MPESGNTRDRKHSQGQRKYSHRCLRQHEEFALVEAISRKACPWQQKQLWSKLEAHNDTYGGRIVVRQLRKHQPILAMRCIHVTILDTRAPAVQIR